ncbi:gpW protein [Cohaesibacter sp. ES.047]|uniref:gpW family head-tail joining protein n=1 Tax=Cohaesibacter sp. ES.047 TaxID=1798205 RepID=UPI000BB9455A|nr:gpW family head-tail joining protein [Cohaesibacter sp. ES.047]SNY93413.1 gpW protein [Cohaesibacter sp. ES.047]
MADTETLTARLAEAENTLHKLLTGDLEREMSQGGKSASFNLPSESKLRAYIDDLKQQLGRPVSRRHHNRRIRF